jgi:fatty-acid desaturase
MIKDIPPHVKNITIPVHILFVLAVTLMVSLGDYVWLWSTLICWTLFSGAGVAVGYHRVLSHKSLDVPLWKQKILTVLGMFGCQGSAIFWCAMHRGYHHPHADTAKDFHSPYHGKWSAYMGWMTKLKPTDVNLKYSVDLLRDEFQVFCHKHYNKIIWCTLAVVALFSWKLALYGFIMAMTWAQHQENLVDLYCHVATPIGYRNFETNDWSTNVALLGWFGWGQGWHNNHHKAPRAFDFGTQVSGKWWEFDPCRLFKPFLK